MREVNRLRRNECLNRSVPSPPHQRLRLPHEIAPSVVWKIRGSGRRLANDAPRWLIRTFPPLYISAKIALENYTPGSGCPRRCEPDTTRTVSP